MKSHLVLVLLLALAGCDSFASRPGEFSGTISGDVTATLDWGAQFGDGKGLILSADSRSIYVDTNDFDGVDPGRYVIGIRDESRIAPADTFAASVRFYSSDHPTRQFVAESGTLVLDAVSASEVRGSLTFTAIDSEDSARKVEVNGRFRAEYVPFCC